MVISLGVDVNLLHASVCVHESVNSLYNCRSFALLYQLSLEWQRSQPRHQRICATVHIHLLRVRGHR